MSSSPFPPSPPPPSGLPAPRPSGSRSAHPACHAPARHTPDTPPRAADHVKPLPRPPAPPPAPHGVGPFAPLRVRGGGAYRLRRMLRRQRRALAAGLALAGAALATTGLGTTGVGATGAGTTGLSSAEGDTAASDAAVPDAAASGTGAPDAGAPDAGAEAGRPAARLVSAPVRIADAATVRLLRPGDRVDVIAVGGPGDDARLVARGVRVAQVPVPAADDGGLRSGGTGTIGADPAPEGALVMLSVERSTATALLGAGASGRLAVAVSDAN
ncbi:hypothetical protein [Streptomyces sp. NPDC059452]|uniref:hypothetical protein n=1 Tax=Streptomyces sp. NPDC059452 TaxID=3346835 RepID=UPI0036819AD5